MSANLDYDVAIVGAGDVGAAIARELSRFDLRLALIEGGPDVGAGTSKANTAILHTGFDAKPDTLEARLVARGHDLLMAYAEEVGIPIERTGALLVAWNDEQLGRLPEIAENADAAGTTAWPSSGPTSSTVASRTSAPGPSAPWRFPTSTSSAPSPRRSPSPPRRCSPGRELRRDERVTGMERLEQAAGGSRPRAAR